MASENTENKMTLEDFKRQNAEKKEELARLQEENYRNLIRKNEAKNAEEAKLKKEHEKELLMKQNAILDQLINKEKAPKSASKTPYPQYEMVPGAKVGDFSMNFDQNGNQVPQKETASHEPPRTPNAADQNKQFVMPSSVFQESKKNFFKPGTKDGFWGILDKKLEDITKAKDPQEMMEKAFWAALNIFFDELNAKMDHDNAEKKRLKSSYKENTQAFDKSRGTDEMDLHQSSLSAMASLLPEEFQKYKRDGQFHFEEMSKSDRKKMEKHIKKDPTIFELGRQVVSYISGREYTNAEYEDFLHKTMSIKSAMSMKNMRSDLESFLKGKKLDSESIGKTVSGDDDLKRQGQTIDSESKEYGESMKNHDRDRREFDNARHGRSNPDNGRPAGSRSRGNEGNAI